MTRCFISVAVTLAAAIACGQDWAKAKVEKSPRHLEWKKVKAGLREVNTLMVYPEVRDKAPVVIIIHEIFGHTDWITDVADQFAAAGYIAVAPDLLSGMAPGGGGSSDFKDSGALRQVISALSPDQITGDLNAVADFAKKDPAANGKLAVVGYCWGGGQSFRFATHRKDLSAAFVFYGSPPSKEDMENIAAPVYGFYGEMDSRINATIPDTQTAMKNLKKTYEPEIYDGAGHGFFRAGEDPAGTASNKKARDDAWSRLKVLLKKVF